MQNSILSRTYQKIVALFDMMLRWIKHKTEDIRYPEDSSHWLMLASEKSLARDWLTPEEDEAWAYLQDE